jgi:hypothetical protein
VEPQRTSTHVSLPSKRRGELWTGTPSANVGFSADSSTTYWPVAGFSVATRMSFA